MSAAGNRHLRMLHILGLLFTGITLTGIFTPLVRQAHGQVGTTAGFSGIVTDEDGRPLPGANIVAVHRPSKTVYGVYTRKGGEYNLHNIRVGGPYLVRVSFIGYGTIRADSVYVSLGENLRLNFQLSTAMINNATVRIIGKKQQMLNGDRTGAATYVAPTEVAYLPSLKRSTRDLLRLDSRSSETLSFSGLNRMYNNITVDGSYFNNPYGVDTPVPGGQTNAEPLPFDAIQEVQVAVAPYDVRQSGFTGASINTITKSGSNVWRASLYSYLSDQAFVGNSVNGEEVPNPDLSYLASGFSASGAIIPDRLFFFLSGELERRDDPGTIYRASRGGFAGANTSRVSADTMQAIRQRMIRSYGYDPGPFENYIYDTNNEKILFKLDYNINPFNNFTFRYNRLDGRRDLPVDPEQLSINNSGRGPNLNSLPFRNSGYEMNNELNSFAAELNSREGIFANRLFVSYGRFRDFRDPFSRPFPTIEIAEDGITYTTLGHDPFSIRKFLRQDVWQFRDDFNVNQENHSLTFGANLDVFKFDNSENLFYYGLFPAPASLGSGLGGSTFSSLEEFFALTDPNNPNFRNFNTEVQQRLQDPINVVETDFGQLAFYAQDEIIASRNVNLSMGLRIDIPLYFSDLPENNIGNSLVLRDDESDFENIDLSKFPQSRLLFAPRFGFNWDVMGNRTTQIRGGTGIFTGRLPFVWLSNQAANLGPDAETPTFDINATARDFKWPQVWKTDLAVDQVLPGEMLGTLELIYGNDIYNVFVRNGNLASPIDRLPGPDGRPVYDRGLDTNGKPLNSLNPNILDAGAGVYILDNTRRGHELNLTAQLRKRFDVGLDAVLAYNFTEAKNRFTSGEQANLIWQRNPISTDPNRPDLSFSEFGNRHRFLGSATFSKRWSPLWSTHFGLFFEFAEGSRFSYVYAGDLNGDGASGNDLIYIPRNSSEIALADITDETGEVMTSAEDQWLALNAFIEQDAYLNKNRGEIARRNGATGPWFSRIDLRVLQDLNLRLGNQRHTFQLSLDVLNLGNLLNSSWGVRQLPNSAAETPLIFTGNFDEDERPIFQFPGTARSTFFDDLTVNSRWQVQFGIRYLFN